MQCPVNLQKDLLRQILSLISAPGETKGQAVDPGVAMPDDDLPGVAVPIPAPRYQFGVGRFQRSDSASTTG